MSLFRSGLVYTAGNIASAAVPFLLLPLLTRLLDAADYGRVVNFFMLVSLSAATAGLTLQGVVGPRWFSLEPPEFRGFMATCLILISLSTAVTAVIVVVVLHFADVGLGLTPGWQVLAVLSAGVTTVLNCRLALWQTQRRAWSAASAQFASSLSNAGLSVIGVVILGLGSQGRMGGAVAASILMGFVGLRSLLRSGDAAGRPSMAHARAALRFGVPLVPHTLAGVAMVTTDRFVVASTMGTSVVGIYGVAAQLGTVMTILTDAYVKTYGPWMYERLKRETPASDLAIVGATWLAVPFFLLVAVCLAAALWLAGGWVLGERFHAALPLMGWFVLGGAFNGMYLSVAGFFFFSSRTELISLVTITSGVCGILLCYLLVRTFGLHGGGAGYAATQLLCFILTFALAARVRKMPWRMPVAGIRALWRELH